MGGEGERVHTNREIHESRKTRVWPFGRSRPSFSAAVAATDAVDVTGFVRARAFQKATRYDDRSHTKVRRTIASQNDLASERTSRREERT